uniref:Uncharacterized protein n=1 Tax=viral metagenome TaxID=1070528 RepID=A0A6C0BQI5_9ZZZZ
MEFQPATMFNDISEKVKLVYVELEKAKKHDKKKDVAILYHLVVRLTSDGLTYAIAMYENESPGSKERRRANNLKNHMERRLVVLRQESFAAYQEAEKEALDRLKAAEIKMGMSKIAQDTAMEAYYNAFDSGDEARIVETLSETDMREMAATADLKAYRDAKEELEMLPMEIYETHHSVETEIKRSKRKLEKDGQTALPHDVDRLAYSFSKLKGPDDVSHGASEPDSKITRRVHSGQDVDRLAYSFSKLKGPDDVSHGASEPATKRTRRSTNDQDVDALAKTLSKLPGLDDGSPSSTTTTGGKPRGRKSRGRKSRGRKSRGRKSRGRR